MCVSSNLINLPSLNAKHRSWPTGFARVQVRYFSIISSPFMCPALHRWAHNVDLFEFLAIVFVRICFSFFIFSRPICHCFNYLKSRNNNNNNRINRPRERRPKRSWARERKNEKKCTKELSRMIDAAQSRKLVVDGYRPLLLHTACTREKLRNGQTNSTFRIFSGANAQRPATLFRITARGK